MATAIPSLPFSTPGAAAAPAYRVIAPLILVKDAAGLLHYKYHGSGIPWLSPEQEAHFLELNMIEKVGFNQPEPDVESGPGDPEPVDLDAATAQDDSTAEEFVVDPEPERETTLQANRIQDCVDVIDEFGISGGSGAPTVREKLRSAGYVFSNDIIAAAVRTRKQPSEPKSQRSK